MEIMIYSRYVFLVSMMMAILISTEASPDDMTDVHATKYTKGGIPKIIHQIWVGPSQPSPLAALYMDSWKHTLGWQYWLWTDEDISEATFPRMWEMIQKARDVGQRTGQHKLSALSDFLRWEILYTYGGLYVDSTHERMRHPDDFLDLPGADLIVTNEKSCTRMCTYGGALDLSHGIYGVTGGIVASAPRHVFFERLLSPSLLKTIKLESPWASIETGPGYFVSGMDLFMNWTILPSSVWFPLSYGSKDLDPCLRTTPFAKSNKQVEYQGTTWYLQYPCQQFKESMSMRHWHVGGSWVSDFLSQNYSDQMREYTTTESSKRFLQRNPYMYGAIPSKYTLLSTSVIADAMSIFFDISIRAQLIFADLSYRNGAVAGCMTERGFKTFADADVALVKSYSMFAPLAITLSLNMANSIPVQGRLDYLNFLTSKRTQYVFFILDRINGVTIDSESEFQKRDFEGMDEWENRFRPHGFMIDHFESNVFIFHILKYAFEKPLLLENRDDGYFLMEIAVMGVVFRPIKTLENEVFDMSYLERIDAQLRIFPQMGHDLFDFCKRYQHKYDKYPLNFCADMIILWLSRIQSLNTYKQDVINHLKKKYQFVSLPIAKLVAGAVASRSAKVLVVGVRDDATLGNLYNSGYTYVGIELASVYYDKRTTKLGSKDSDILILATDMFVEFNQPTMQPDVVVSLHIAHTIPSHRHPSFVNLLTNYLGHSPNMIIFSTALTSASSMYNDYVRREMSIPGAIQPLSYWTDMFYKQDRFVLNDGTTNRLRDILRLYISENDLSEDEKLFLNDIVSSLLVFVPEQLRNSDDIDVWTKVDMGQVVDVITRSVSEDIKDYFGDNQSGVIFAPPIAVNFGFRSADEVESFRRLGYKAYGVDLTSRLLYDGGVSLPTNQLHHYLFFSSLQSRFPNEDFNLFLHLPRGVLVMSLHAVDRLAGSKHDEFIQALVQSYPRAVVFASSGVGQTLDYWHRKFCNENYQIDYFATYNIRQTILQRLKTLYNENNSGTVNTEIRYWFHTISNLVIYRWSVDPGQLMRQRLGQSLLAIHPTIVDYLNKFCSLVHCEHFEDILSSWSQFFKTIELAYQSDILFSQNIYNLSACTRFSESLPKEDTFEIRPDYEIRPHNSHYDDVNVGGDVYQLGTYLYAAHIMRKHQFKRIVDVGCGNGYKTVHYLGEFDTIGTETDPAYTFLMKTYPHRKWLKSGESEESFQAYADLTADVVMSADVIEHIHNPDLLLDFLDLHNPKFIILSTPERGVRISVNGKKGPPYFTPHVREWTFFELERYLSRRYDVLEHFTANDQNECQIILLQKRTHDSQVWTNHPPKTLSPLPIIPLESEVMNVSHYFPGKHRIELPLKVVYGNDFGAFLERLCIAVYGLSECVVNSLSPIYRNMLNIIRFYSTIDYRRFQIPSISLTNIRVDVTDAANNVTGILFWPIDAKSYERSLTPQHDLQKHFHIFLLLNGINFNNDHLCGHACISSAVMRGLAQIPIMK